MHTLTLYHGSSEMVIFPQLDRGKCNNDYGRGFYCTEHIELAKEWSCSKNNFGLVNMYKLKTDGLKILDLEDERYSILNWLAILLVHRIVKTRSVTEEVGIDYIVKNFLPEFESYDIIRGYRADDSYFLFARQFVQGAITLKQLERAMYLGELGEQVVLKSEKAFGAIDFIGVSKVDHDIYYSKRVERDHAAKETYRKILKERERQGLRIFNITEEEMKPDDERLQRKLYK